MKKIKLILITCLFFCVNTKAQFDEKQFFNRVNSIYHNLENSEIENFAVKITSDYFEYNAGEGINHDLYSPIEFIWAKPRQLFFNRMEFPTDVDSIQKSNIIQLQNEMFQELRGVFMDWQRFLGGKLLYDLPEKFTIDTVQDTVHIMFESFEMNDPIKMKFYFGLNALCFRIETTYEKINQKIITFPTFVLVDDKWLCTEWVVKIIQYGEITSGFSVNFRSGRYKNNWLPIQALVQVQSKQKLNQTFTRLYKFRGMEINK